MFERVYTMTSYYDGPREGVADFCGRPHTYSCPFDSSIDDYTDLYELRALDDETFSLALEDWAIWLRWQDAFHRGLTTLQTHPALPPERLRHAQLASILAQRLAPRHSRSRSFPACWRW